MAPQLNQEKYSINTANCIDFCRSFNWINNTITNKLSAISEEFLSAQFQFYLLAITDKPSIIWKGNDYFVTQIEAANNCFLHIRISNVAAQILLDNAFGTREGMKGELQLKNITELEARILTAYNEFLFKNLDNVFIDKKEITKIKSSENLGEDLVHLTFYVYSDNSDQEGAGKIIFSFPHYILKKPELIKAPEKPLDILQFQKSCTEANVFVGKTKITLEDLKNLELEDIVILEKSSLHSMIIKGDEDIAFNVNPDPRIVINVDDSEGGQEKVSDTNSAIQNIWDSLQVDVNAEFQKIKISLGELRQITEGLVVDIAPIIQNEIFLQVEGKQVAAGELVIIGDRYGVKITQVFHETKQEQEIATQQAAIEQNKANPNEHSSQEHIEEENTDDDTDFDYSDFEIEDDI